MSNVQEIADLLREIADLRRQKSELEDRISAALGASDIVAMMNYQSRFDVICEELESDRNPAPTH